MSDALSARLAQEQARKVATEIAEPVARTTATAVATDVAGRTAQTIARDTAVGIAEAQIPTMAQMAERIAALRVEIEVNDWLRANPPAPGKAGLSVQGEKGDDGDDGKPGLVWRGPWSRGTQYQPNDAVSFEGSSYVATRPTRAKPPAGWDLLAERGEPGETTGPAILTSRGFGRGGYASGVIVDDESVALNGGTVLGEIDFQGAGVSVVQVGGKAVATIPGGGGGGPTGPAGGDLSGTYPNPDVVDDSHNHTGATAPGLVTSVNELVGDVTIAAHVYVTDTDPGALAVTGDLWVDTTTPGPPWHVQIRNATDDGWEDLLEQYTATNSIVLTAGGDGQAAVLHGANGLTGDGGGVSFAAGADSTGSGSGATANAVGGTATAGGAMTLRGGNGDEDIAGGEAFLAGGNGNDGDDAGARFTAKGGDGVGNPGKAQVTTNGSTGPGPLVSDGTDVTYSPVANVPAVATGGLVLLSDVITALGDLQTSYNDLLAKMKTALVMTPD